MADAACGGQVGRRLPRTLPPAAGGRGSAVSAPLHWASGPGQPKSATLREIIRLTQDGSLAFLCLVAVEYNDAPLQLYLLPMSFVRADGGENPQPPANVVAQVKGVVDGYLLDALQSAEFCRAVLHTVARREAFCRRRGRAVVAGTPSGGRCRGAR